MFTSGSLLEMVLESHIEIKRIPAVPESDTDESAATCEQTRMLRFLTGQSDTNTTRTYSHPHRCHPVSAGQSIGWNR